MIARTHARKQPVKHSLLIPLVVLVLLLGAVILFSLVTQPIIVPPKSVSAAIATVPTTTMTNSGLIELLQLRRIVAVVNSSGQELRTWELQAANSSTFDLGEVRGCQAITLIPQWFVVAQLGYAAPAAAAHHQAQGVSVRVQQLDLTVGTSKRSTTKIPTKDIIGDSPPPRVFGLAEAPLVPFEAPLHMAGAALNASRVHFLPPGAGAFEAELAFGTASSNQSMRIRIIATATECGWGVEPFTATLPAGYVYSWKLKGSNSYGGPRPVDAAPTFQPFGPLNDAVVQVRHSPRVLAGFSSDEVAEVDISLAYLGLWRYCRHTVVP